MNIYHYAIMLFDRFSSEEEAVAIANATSFGLAGWCLVCL